MSDQSWNFLIITTDEEQYPTSYESESIRQWRAKYRPALNAIKRNGMEFTNHYAASTACSPSRACIYTGQYPSLHGVTQTSGMAKDWYDPDMMYLDPNTVPTMGDYFRAGGYRTFYRGKWHVSHPDIITPGTKNVMLSTDGDGNTLPRAEEIYHGANKVGDYGFDGWIGPDPHGAEKANMGVNRDGGFARQTCSLLEALDKQDSDQPWLTVASFTNPHDIVFFGLPWLNFGYTYEFPEDIANLEFALPPTRFEDLSTKPRCQADYAEKYGEMFFRNPTIPQYYQLYYYLQQLVDTEINKVLTSLAKTRFADNTIIVYTSDHGDLMGAHGGMHQKWYNAYEETIHVPFVVSSPQLFSEPQRADALTSHVDLIPTLLGLAGIDEKDAAKTLRRDHSEVHDLPGRDWSKLILDGEKTTDGALYFMTDDEVSEGLDTLNPRGNPYQGVSQPCNVETVITRMKGDDGKECTWKFSRYYSNPKYWNTTGNPDAEWSDHEEGGPAELELYNLTEDPLETCNLVHKLSEKQVSAQMVKRLFAVLAEQRAAKRKHPTFQTRFSSAARV